MATLGRKAFRLQNRWRKSHGAPRLKWHPKLALTSKAACLVIIEEQRLRHHPRWYATMKRYLGNREYAENIGWGFNVPTGIIEGWDESAAHDKIMRDRTLVHGAISTVYSRKIRKRVWVAHYAGK